MKMSEQQRVASLAALTAAALLVGACACPCRPAPGARERSKTMQKREGLVTKGGDPLALVGSPVSEGDAAPDFTAVDTDGSEVRFADIDAEVRVLVSVPSVDTSVCDTEARRFNEEATGLGPNVEVIVLSMDLPYAQKRWCAAAGVDRVTMLSDHRTAEFGERYGVLIDGARLLARTVFVVDKAGKVRYVQIVPDLKQEPDYAAVLEAIENARN